MTHLRCILRKAGEERESMKKMRIRGTKEWKEKAILVGTLDLVTILGSYFLALLLRFDFLFSSILPMNKPFQYLFRLIHLYQLKKFSRHLTDNP